jgi:transcriptional regulator NrdR family protein
MKCPVCGAWSLVKQTRDSPTFGHIRRRECANEHRFTTKEVFIPQEDISKDQRERLESIREGRRKNSRKDTQ